MLDALDAADDAPTTADLARATGLAWSRAWVLLHAAEGRDEVLSWPDDVRDRRWARHTLGTPVLLDPVPWGPPVLR